jgi:uncharacterized alkaline shock family protein YloU
MTGISPSLSSATTPEPDESPASPAAINGKTVINNSVVGKIAGLAARDVPGVHALGGGAARALGAIREAISNTDHTQGVTLQVGESDVTVDLSIVAEYPVPLQQLADDLRNAVIGSIENLTGLKVPVVNVTINDVHLPEGATEAAEAPVQ